MAVNEFILTVADVEVYDSSDDLIFTSETMIDNTLTQSVNTQEVRGGEFSQLLIEYSFEKNLEITLNDAQFQAQFLAFNNGSSYVNGNFDVYEQEEVTLASDDGTLSATPVGDIYVKRQNGSIQTITPSGTNFTVTGAGNELVDVRYRTSKNVDRLQVESDGFPSTFRLVMRAKIFDSDNGQGTPVGFFIVEIPNWKVMGNYELTFNTGSPVTSMLTGKALAFNDATTGKSIYANYFIDKTINDPVSQVTNILATPDSVTLDISDGDTSQVQVIGIRGNGLTNITNPTGVTYASDTPGVATVSSSGLISPVGAGTAIVTATLNTLTDTIDVTVQA